MDTYVENKINSVVDYTVYADFNVMNARANIIIVTNMPHVIILEVNSLTMSAYKLVGSLWQIVVHQVTYI